MGFLSALNYGIIGLGAILALLSYYLLQQDRQRTAPVYVFMVFSLAIIGIGVLSENIKTIGSLSENLQITGTNGGSKTISQSESENANLNRRIGDPDATLAKIADTLNEHLGPFEQWAGYITNQPCSGGAHGTNPEHADAAAKAYQDALNSMKTAISLASGK